MAWLGLIFGVVIGAAFHGLEGAFALGFLGWLIGFIIKAKGKPEAPARVAADPDGALLIALNRRIAALEARLARVEKLTIGETATVPVPAVEESAGTIAMPPEPAALQPEPVPPTPEPAVASTPRIDDAVATPPEPAKPNFIVAWFTGGNTIVRVGLVILFVGLAFLIKYGVEHQLVPVELRVAGVAAAGMALLAVGWWLRSRRAGYALSLQGAGVAVLYLTVFGALRLYHLLPPGFAFALLVAIAALSAFLAVAQDSLALAVFGAAGGFLAPILASTGHGDHVMLFSYYIVLNAAIVGMAWFRAWRVLNVLGFVFTFLVGLAWGMRSYSDDLFASTEPFVAIFFLMYVGIALLFARKQVAALRDPVDATIVFGVPIAAFGLQAGMLRGSEFGLAYSSVAAGALYLALATALRRLPQERWGLLAKAFLALGMVFASLAIPLALDARWTSAAWAAEGAGVVWIATRQGSRLARAFGILLQLLAAAAFVKAYPALPPGPPLANAAFIGMLLVALASFLTHRMLAPSARPGTPEHMLVPVFFLWGLAWWLTAGLHEIETSVDLAYRPAAMLLFATATTGAFAMLARRKGWDAFRWPEWAFAPVLALFTLLFWVARSHPAADLGWVAWPLALAAHFLLLRGDDSRIPREWSGVQHVVGALVVAALGAMELQWAAAVYAAPHTAWSASARMVMPAIVVLAISCRAADSRWPVGAHEAAYRLFAAPLLIAAMAVWSLFINFTHDGSSDPLPYLPLLNALDLGHVLAIFAGLAWWLALRRRALATPEALRGRHGMAMLAVLVFAWLNAILLRSIHHWTGVPYLFWPMFASVTVQAALSIFWSVLALSLMLWATRGGRRTAWMVGAGLMAVVVVKLVLLDLSHLSGLPRILAFIVVGVLMLVIGYFSPVPPKTKEEAA